MALERGFAMQQRHTHRLSRDLSAHESDKGQQRQSNSGTGGNNDNSHRYQLQRPVIASTVARRKHLPSRMASSPTRRLPQSFAQCCYCCFFEPTRGMTLSQAARRIAVVITLTYAGIALVLIFMGGRGVHLHSSTRTTSLSRQEAISESIWKRKNTPFWWSHNRNQPEQHKDVVDEYVGEDMILPKRRGRRRTRIDSASTTLLSTLLTDEELQRPEQIIDMRILQQELPFENADGGVWKQGFELQPKSQLSSNKLQIFVVPHTHVDTSHMQTFDESYTKRVSRILNTIVPALMADHRRTFVWSEVAFLAKWWKEQNGTTRHHVRTLLAEGRLELVSGGWVQPDEAVTTLYALQVQLQEGQDWIRTTLGADYVPTISWSIDAYGHSPTLAYLWKKQQLQQQLQQLQPNNATTLTAMVIQRVHYAVKKELGRRKHLEFFWRQAWEDDNDATTASNANQTVDPINGQRIRPRDVFTHIMPFFAFDVPHSCGPDPATCCQFDFGRSTKPEAKSCPWGQPPQIITKDNIRERAALLLDQYRKKASLYRSNAVLIPLGDANRYILKDEAEAQYSNYQTLFDYINAHYSDVAIQFGTLSEYFEAARQTFDGLVPIVKGSFLPYADVDDHYWTGYYTSRVFDKALGRQLERVLYAADSMGETSCSNASSVRIELQEARRALALFQHHDAIGGTSKSIVVEDHAARMAIAVTATQEWMLRTMLTSTNSAFDKIASSLAESREIRPCNVALGPRVMSNNLCSDSILLFNPLEVDQTCGDVVVRGREFVNATLPCEVAGPAKSNATKFVFDNTTGLMLQPIQEEWKVWKVESGSAYLFAGGQQSSFNFSSANHKLSDNGYTTLTPFWKRTAIEKDVLALPGGATATVIDFVYETDIRPSNQEWVVRFSCDIDNDGYFYTDLNGFDIDTHRFRDAMPVQSQVFPMSMMASIQDKGKRMTIISEHAQAASSFFDGSIDVWLDRTLEQDSLTDNRRLRTRFRLVLERDGFGPQRPFDLTPFARRMMNEIQHPLEMFGKHKKHGSKATPYLVEAFRRFESNSAAQKVAEAAAKETKPVNYVRGRVFRDVTTKVHQVENTVVPFVYMIYKRVDYLKTAMESLRRSDFPRDRVPIVISHDGHVPDIMDYVESLKGEFQVHQIFHPHACYDHPDTFPGEDPKLNEGYSGDAYGNPRSFHVTCCKHHFTWLLKTVFTDLDFGDDFTVDTFLFLEEDYVVAPTIYQAITEGLNAMDQFASETRGGAFLGLSLDPTGGGLKPVAKNAPANAWNALPFVSGPMTLHRSTFQKLQQHAAYYCGLDGFDEYNWDWSFVHMQNKFLLPHTVLSPPTNKQLAKHIGIEGGMHGHKKNKKAAVLTQEEFEKLDVEFAGTKILGTMWINPKPMRKGNGGWGHPADQEHCLRLLAVAGTNSTNDTSDAMNANLVNATESFGNKSLSP